MEVKPYIEHKISESVAIRTFSMNIEESELEWHWDEEDRVVTGINISDWKFQFDNELPISFDQPIYIKAGRIHRVIKGTDKLIVKIIKL